MVTTHRDPRAETDAGPEYITDLRFRRSLWSRVCEILTSALDSKIARGEAIGYIYCVRNGNRCLPSMSTLLQIGRF